MVQDVDNAQVTADGDLIIDDSLYQSISNGGTMTMNGGAGFAIKALDSAATNSSLSSCFSENCSHLSRKV